MRVGIELAIVLKNMLIHLIVRFWGIRGIPFLQIPSSSSVFTKAVPHLIQQTWQRWSPPVGQVPYFPPVKWHS